MGLTYLRTYLSFEPVTILHSIEECPVVRKIWITVMTMMITLIAMAMTFIIMMTMTMTIKMTVKILMTRKGEG